MKIVYNTFDSDVWYSIPIETKCHTDFILFATRLRIKQRFDFYQFIPDLRHYIPVTHFVHFPREKSDFVPVIPLPSCQETFRLMAISCVCQHSSGPVNGQQYCAICSSTLCMKYDVFHSIRIIGIATIGSLRIQQGIIDFIRWTPLGLGGHLWA